jgi:hypothetical protein
MDSSGHKIIWNLLQIRLWSVREAPTTLQPNTLSLRKTNKIAKRWNGENNTRHGLVSENFHRWFAGRTSQQYKRPRQSTYAIKSKFWILAYKVAESLGFPRCFNQKCAGKQLYYELWEGTQNSYWELGSHLVYRELLSLISLIWAGFLISWKNYKD